MFKNKILFIFLFFFLMAFLLINQKKMPLRLDNKIKKITTNEELAWFLNNISREDKKALDLLFRYFFSESFAYTLYGNKPIGLSSYYVFRIYDHNHKKIYPLYQIAYSFYNAYYPKNVQIKKAWKTWKKYAPLFSESKYIFLEEFNSLNDRTLNIILVNKKEFFKTINIYKEDFQKVLKDEVDPERILKKCRNGESLFKGILQNHQGLQGILLGYGKNNSWNFYQRNLLRKRDDGSQEIKNEITILNKKLIPFAEDDNDKYYNVILKELSENNNEDEFTHLYLFPMYISLPMFVADPEDNETKLLEQKYKETREFIQECYNGKDFLEVTLKKFIE